MGVVLFTSLWRIMARTKSICDSPLYKQIKTDQNHEITEAVARRIVQKRCIHLQLYHKKSLRHGFFASSEKFPFFHDLSVPFLGHSNLIFYSTSPTKTIFWKSINSLKIPKEKTLKESRKPWTVVSKRIQKIKPFWRCFVWKNQAIWLAKNILELKLKN